MNVHIKLNWVGLLMLLALGACGGGGSNPGAPAKIQHVIIIMQENRTPDNLFHGFPNADIASSGLDSQGQTITLTPVSLVEPYDLHHAHAAFTQMYGSGKMDGADKIAVFCPQSNPACAPLLPQFQYVNPSEVAPYFALGEQYVFADRMFQTNQGPSYPAHQYIIAGTSEDRDGSHLSAAENPSTTSAQTGCGTVQSGEVVTMINLLTGAEDTSEPTCFEHATLLDLLDTAGISWRYYTPSAGSIWTGPNSIAHIWSGPDWAKVIIPETQVLTDIRNGALPQVSWVIPSGQASDHAAITDGSGPSWVASVVNAIGGSRYWDSTAILLVWDDWGGWYDHVAPTIYDPYEYGFRVPLIVISPYAKSGYVSHVTHDFGSLLRFIEDNFGLPTLGHADERADNLADCFDFSQTPRGFQAIPAKFDGQYFIQQRALVPATDPDNE